MTSSQKIRISVGKSFWSLKVLSYLTDLSFSFFKQKMGIVISLSEIFFFFFFGMWTIFKAFTGFVTILSLFFVLHFHPQGMWDLSP